MAATVTIDQGYFETLLRRAEFHSTGRDLSTPVDVPLVNIPKVDHDNLLRMALEYDSLRQALFKGGIEQETLETLINGEQSTLGPLHEWTDSGGPLTQKSKLFSRPEGGSFDANGSFGSRWQASDSVGSRSGGYNGGRRYYSRQNSSALEDDSNFTPNHEKEDGFFSASGLGKRYYERNEQRTILAKNLHERTTHKDITEILRGGTVLDIYLRSNDRTASISFVEGQHAQNFMNQVKRNDIYVHGKRVEWAWSDRQFILPGHVANKIGTGATRNLIIRSCLSSITETKLREDLDHIHNLVIIDITFANGDCHISLNSIHNSLFARTCMMSRAVYKGMKIEWYEDECSLPLPEPKRASKENRRPPKKTATKPMNRFQMLGIDGNDTVGGEEDADDITTTTDMTGLTLNARIPWDASSSVAT